MPDFTTIEYIINNGNNNKPIFLLMVDTAITSEELADLKESL
jgi:hypothetical protein